MEEKKDKIKIGIGAWIALIFFIIILSGVFRTSDTPLKILDLTNLTGTFGLIGDTESNFMGSGEAAPKMVSWQASICCQASCSLRAAGRL